MNDDWAQASVDGDLKDAEQIQSRVAREARLSVEEPLHGKYDQGLEALLPDTRTPVPQDRFYCAFQRLDAIMAIEPDDAPPPRKVINVHAWQAHWAEELMGRRPMEDSHVE